MSDDVLMPSRLPRVGVSYKPATPASSTRKILLVLHYHVGTHPVLHGCSHELLRSHCGPLLSWGFRGGGDPGVLILHITGEF